MNRSLRRASVMCWTIAGGALVTAAGLLPAAPAFADVSAGVDARAGADDRTSPGVTRRTARAADSATGRETQRITARGAPRDVPRRNARAGRGADAISTTISTSDTTVSTSDTKPEPRPRPCQHWPYWPPWPSAPDPEVGNQNVMFAGVAPPVPAAPPVATTSWAPRSAATVSLADPGLPPSVSSAAGTPGSAVPDSAVSNGGLSRRNSVPTIPLATPPASGASTPVRAALTPPAELPPPATLPQSMLPHTAGVAEAVRQALPGLVGLAVLTGAGGLLGYRQAKAGFALRAAGTARYLR